MTIKESSASEITASAKYNPRHRLSRNAINWRPDDAGNSDSAASDDGKAPSIGGADATKGGGTLPVWGWFSIGEFCGSGCIMLF